MGSRPKWRQRLNMEAHRGAVQIEERKSRRSCHQDRRGSRITPPLRPMGSPQSNLWDLFYTRQTYGNYPVEPMPGD